MKDPRAYRNFLVAVGSVIVLSTTSWTASAERSQAAKKSDGVAATVMTDGALILDKPDPDANPIGQLAEETKIRVSTQPLLGTDGAKYRRVRVGKRIGYIPEIDIRIGNAPTRSDDESGQGKNARGKNAKTQKEAKRRAAAKKRMSAKSEEMLFSRFVGLLIGTSEYKEGIDGVNATENLIVYGLKITGPDLILSGPIVDFNLALHYGVPSYYGPLSKTKPTGFLLLTDLLFVAPFMHAQNSILYVAGGPLLAFSKYALVNSDRTMDLTQLNLGLSLAVAGAVRFEKVALRLEAKYLIEKQSYKTLQAAIQTQF